MTGIRVTNFKSGEWLFTQGQSAKAMYFVLSGNVQTGKSGSDSLSTGAVIGAIEFLNQRSFTYSARCLSDAMVLELDEELTIQLFRKQPQIAYNILKAVATEVPETKEDMDSQDILNQEIETVEANDSALLNQLLPSGHPRFAKKLELKEIEQYIFHQEINCPICTTSFTGTRVRHSRLMTREIRHDYRIVYQDFEPLWYYIWVCPKCLFAYPQAQFTKLSDGFKDRISRARMKEPLEGSFRFSPERTLDEVFHSYYLALRTYELVKIPVQQWGNLWLRLLWLYEDAKSEKWATSAAEKALSYFQETIESSWQQETSYQKLYIIMAELCIRLGQREVALRYLLEAVNIKPGHEGYRRKASDRIHDLRHPDQ